MSDSTEMTEDVKTAVDFMKSGKFEKAIEAFKDLLDTHEENRAEIFNNIGVAYANLGKNEEAEENFVNSLKINPTFAQTYINLADLYYKRQELELAIDILTTGESYLPNDVVISHYLARIYMEDSRLDLAIDELDKVLEIQPENYDAYYDLAKVYFDMGDWSSAIANFESVVEYKPNNSLIYYYLGQSYEANDEIDKAISNYLKTLTINDKFHPAYKKLGILFLARKDYEDALEYFNEYIEHDIPQEEIDNTKKIIKKVEALINEG